MPRGDSAKAKILKYFLDHIGEVVTTHHLNEISGIQESARRIRELRDEEGWQILNHSSELTPEQIQRIRPPRKLKSGEYVLLDTERLDVTAREIGKDVRSTVLQRYGATCQLCGRRAGDPDPYNPNKRLNLHLDHRVSLKDGGTNDEENLWPICSICNEGKKERSIISKDVLQLLQDINMQPPEVQRMIYERLKERFG